LTFAHLVEPTPAGSRFTHRITITGLLSPLFARIIGSQIAARLRRPAPAGAHPRAVRALR